MSVDGIDSDNGFTTYYDKEADIDRTMIEQSEICIVAADTSKFERTAFAKISDSEVADYIVTNATVGEEIYKNLKKQGITIIRA